MIKRVKTGVYKCSYSDRAGKIVITSRPDRREPTLVLLFVLFAPIFLFCLLFWHTPSPLAALEKIRAILAFAWHHREGADRPLVIATLALALLVPLQLTLYSFSCLYALLIDKVVTIEKGTLTIQNRLPGISRRQSFPLADVTLIRMVAGMAPVTMLDSYLYDDGRPLLIFDHKGQEHPLTFSISEPEALALMEKLVTSRTGADLSPPAPRPLFPEEKLMAPEGLRRVAPTTEGDTTRFVVTPLYPLPLALPLFWTMVGLLLMIPLLLLDNRLPVPDHGLGPYIVAVTVLLLEWILLAGAFLVGSLSLWREEITFSPGALVIRRGLAWFPRSSHRYDLDALSWVRLHEGQLLKKGVEFVVPLRHPSVNLETILLTVVFLMVLYAGVGEVIAIMFLAGALAQLVLFGPLSWVRVVARFDHEAFTTSHYLGRWRIATKVAPLSEIVSVQVMPDDSYMVNEGGALLVTHKERTYSLGSTLSQAEARMIIRLLSEKFPSLVAANEAKP